MNFIKLTFMISFLICLTSTLFADGQITIYSAISAEVFINDMKQSSINPTDPCELTIKENGNYVIEVRAKNSSLVHREEIRISKFSDIKKVIRAFETESTPTSQSLPSQPANQPQLTSQPQPANNLSREEVAEAIEMSTRKAKDEALAEESARREREKERETGNKVFNHLLTIEADKNLSEQYKQLERKRLGIELSPQLNLLNLLGGK